MMVGPVQAVPQRCVLDTQGAKLPVKLHLTDHPSVSDLFRTRRLCMVKLVLPEPRRARLRNIPPPPLPLCRYRMSGLVSCVIGHPAHNPICLFINGCGLEA